MAKLILNDEVFTLEDGAKIDAICESAGVPFSCNSGVCGTCQIMVLEGSENLNELNTEEKDLGLNPKTRLSCQCRIKHGTVRITY